jgi:tetratricopeptide (TPR) repeat protein
MIAVITVVAFSPSLENDFVLWDDAGNFLYNPNFRGLGWRNILWMFTTFHLGPYMPVTWLTLGADYLVWGLDPFGYHLTSLVIHAGAAVLCYSVARRLIAAALSRGRGDTVVRAGSAVAALLFAIHPLRVESVAWASERRDVVSGALALLTVLAYLRSTEDERPRRWYRIAVGCFTLAALAKAIVAPLPIVLLILDVYPLKRLSTAPGARRVRALVVEKAPFFAVAAVTGALAIVGQRHGGALASLTDVGLARRVAFSAYSMAFYLGKLVWPVNLSPLYARPDGVGVAPTLAAGATLVVITAAAVALRRRFPGLLAAWAAYLVLGLPVSGLVHTAFHIAADRYTYLPAIGWSIVAGGLVALAWNRTAWRWASTALAILAVAALGAVTWRQTQFWRDTEALWRRAAAAAPSAFAYAALAEAQLERGADAEALESARRALALDPASPWANATLADVILSTGGRPDDAVQLARRAVERGPALFVARFSLARALGEAGKTNDAIREYRAALQLDPTSVMAYNNLGVLLWRAGKTDEAEQLFRHALALYPDHELAHVNLGHLLRGVGREEEGVKHLRHAEHLGTRGAR